MWSEDSGVLCHGACSSYCSSGLWMYLRQAGLSSKCIMNKGHHDAFVTIKVILLSPTREVVNYSPLMNQVNTAPRITHCVERRERKARRCACPWKMEFVLQEKERKQNKTTKVEHYEPLQKGIKGKCSEWRDTKLCSEEALEWVLEGFRKARTQKHTRERTPRFLRHPCYISVTIFYNDRLGPIGLIHT